jgi:prepilin-type N-terminal cleavage/methylation domain-containing protein
MKNHTLQQGFTIIETLVAITILMISIAGPLTIAHKGLIAATYSRDQIVASYLAQDVVEYVKNIRDNNVIREDANWLNGFYSCTATNPCKVDTRIGNPTDPATLQISSCTHTSATSCGMYRTPTNGYSTSGTGNPQFLRYFYIINKSAGGTSGGIADEAQLVVVVKWNQGAVQNQVVYENELFNIRPF